MDDKLWSDCSKEEHRLVRKWNKARKKAREQYENGQISRRKYLDILDRLEKVLDRLEKEGAEDETENI